jgi:addiction module RelE/StbE family toxin
VKLIWLERALEDQDLILDYITERNEAAAEDLYAAINACCQRILKHPFMYRPGRAPGTREAVVHPNYILIYCVTGEAVEIVRLVHSRQQYP